MEQTVAYALIADNHCFRVPRCHNPFEQRGAGKNNVGPFWFEANDALSFRDGFFSQRQDLTADFLKGESAAVNLAVGVSL